MGETVIDPPVVLPVGVGERAPGDRASEARVIAFAAHRIQTRDDVAEAFAERELGEGECKKLIAAAEAARPTVAAVTTDAGVELMTRQVVHQLGEYELAGQHREVSTSGIGSFRSGF